mmetsp:Transcript_14169/g.23578  ORF Transcript_14169/g.23578 Transcript_14169/m.23578 type:complete len:202 (+) Transcript_14169:1-606(+)
MEFESQNDGSCVDLPESVLDSGNIDGNLPSEDRKADMAVNDTSKKGVKLAPFNPAGEEVILTAIELLRLTDNGALVYDLGCGDARFLVKVSQLFPSIRSIGVEYDQNIYIRACELVQNSGASSEQQIQLLHDNVLNIPFEADADAIFVYLVPQGMKLLRDRLLIALARGARIVTYVFSIPDLEPTEVRLYKSSTKIYLYCQ